MKINKIDLNLHFIVIFLGYETYGIDVFYNRKYQKWLFNNSTDSDKNIYPEFDINGFITNVIFTPLINGHILKESYFIEKEFRQVDLLDLEQLNLSQKIQVDAYREYLEKRKTIKQPEAIDLIGTSNTEKIKKNEDKNWFKVGLLFATGEITDLLKKFENNATQIAKHKGNISFRPHITESLGNSKKTSSQSIYYPDKFKVVYNHCKENNIKMTIDFEAYYTEIELDLN